MLTLSMCRPEPLPSRSVSRILPTSIKRSESLQNAITRNLGSRLQRLVPQSAAPRTAPLGPGWSGSLAVAVCRLPWGYRLAAQLGTGSFCRTTLGQVRFRLCSFTHHQSGSPKFLVVLSVRAARLYPGKSSGWCQLPFQSLVLASALLSRLATFLFVFRGFGRRFAFAAARTCAVPEAFAARLPSAPRAASCLITLYMANSFQLTKTPRLSLAHQKEAKLQSPIPIFPRTTITRSRLALRGS